MRGTVTLVFTDIVGSTRLLGEIGDEAAEGVIRRHFTMLRREVARAGGREVKSLGDGLMLVFGSASDAVACAIAMQQVTAQAEDGLGLRVGVHAGEPSQDGEDFFGTPVVVAQRLCARAQGGEIVISDVVRGLLARRGSHRLRPLGEIALKGLDEPLAACLVEWREGAPEPVAPDAPAAQPPLPAALVDRGGTAFVGRTDALARLRKALRDAESGRLRLITLSGEPGIGKTRLACEFAALAHAGGAAVLFGRADEEGLVPYQPFAEAVRGCLAGSAAGAAPPGLGALLPEHGDTQPPGGDPAMRRYLLFDAATGFLAAAARTRPVLLVLDDLHWADAPTLLLLRHLVREAATARILVLATYRETDLSRKHPLAEALADLRREKLVERVALRGLSEEDVGELLARVAGHRVPEPFVRALHDETEGNPFFLEEVLRHLAETGAIFVRDGRWTSARPIEQLGIPEGVREAIGRRLARLSETCNRTLGAAAVLGRRWDFELLVGMVDASEDELMDALEEALAAQLIVEADGVHAFTHALVRETLYDELSLPRRQRMHLRAVAAIERRHDRDLEAHASALALHLGLAGAAADPQKALEWSLRAADVAARALGWEEAAGHLATALERLEEMGSPLADRARVLERTADLKYIAGFDLEGAVTDLERALEAYETAGLPERAARVHSRIARDRATFFGPTHDVPAALEHLEAARSVLEREPEGLPIAYLLIGQATAAVWQLQDAREPGRLAGRAMEIADRLGHRQLWRNAAALVGNGLCACGEVRAGLDLLERVWHDADRVDDSWVAFLATWSLAGAGQWITGPRPTLHAVDREMARPRVAGAAGQRSFLSLLRGQALTELGDLAGAETAHEESQSATPWGFDAMILSYRGAPEDAVERFEATIEQSRASGNLWSEIVVGLREADLLTATGDPRAQGLVERAVVVASAAGNHILEAHARAHSAVQAVEWGTVAAGRRHLVRCAAIVDGGEDWGRIAARVDQARGVLAGEEGEAEAWFARALERTERLEMPLARAEVLRSQGLRLAEHEPARAVDRFDRALDIYVRAGAGPVWTDGLRAVRDRAAALVGG